MQGSPTATPAVLHWGECVTREHVCHNMSGIAHKGRTVVDCTDILHNVSGIVRHNMSAIAHQGRTVVNCTDMGRTACMLQGFTWG